MPAPIFGICIAGTSSDPQDEAVPRPPNPEDVAFERSQNVHKDRTNKSLVWEFYSKHPTRKRYVICKLCHAAGKNSVYSAGLKK